MRRRNFFVVSILVLIGIFCWLNFSAKADSNFEHIIQINDGNITSTIALGWQYQNNGSSDEFITMRTSTSIIITPLIDLSNYSSAKINFKAKTYYGIGESARIYISISEDNGNSWQNIYSHLPLSSTATTTPDFSLDNYLSKQIKIKFQTASSTSSKGAAITSISILGIKTIIPSSNTPPRSLIHSSSTGYLNEEIEFDGSESSDDEHNIFSYYWDFGDSSSSNEIIASHLFPAIGNYLVSLTVTDDDGASSTATSSINILPINNATTTPTSTPTSTPPTSYIMHDIVINEFVSGPTTNNPEWVELFNNTSSTIDLNNWSVNDGSGKTTTLATTTTLIQPNNFFVIYGIDGNLNNTGDLIILRDPLGNIIDRVAYGNWDDGNILDNAPATDDNNATARNTNGLSTYNDKNDFSITITPTPESINIITPKPNTGGGSYATPKLETPKLDATTTPTSTVKYSDLIIINEILPRPSADETNKEFIELKNLSTSSIDLAGWILGDNSNNRYTFPLNNATSTTISSSSLLLIERTQSKIALNNSGVEAVKVYSPDGKLIDLVEYTGPVEKDYSYSRDEKGNFHWTSIPTPGDENIFSSSSEADTPDDTNQPAPVKKTTTKTTSVKVTKAIPPTQRVNLENISSLAIGDNVITQGIVSVEPGVLGTQIFYLAGSGIQVYCNKKDFPNLKVGDYIEVSGTLSEASGERRIKITGKDNIKIISQGQSPEVHQIATSEVSENMVGSLAKIKGTVLEVKGNNIYIDDGSEEAKVYIKASTGITIKELNIKPGDNIEITGIVSNASGGYRLLPRYITDITKTGEVKGDFATSTPTQNSQPQAWKYYVAINIFLIFIIAWLIYKFKYSNIKNKKE